MNNKADFKEKYSEYLSLLNDEISKYSEDAPPEQKIVFDAMSYTLLGGGKRIRPVLCMAVSDMLGGDIRTAAVAAYALECIHNYSLIHDDLPCMDDDDMRRGRPTCHKVFPENIALLAGDGLLNRAFEILSDRRMFEAISEKQQLLLIRELSAASGAFGMIGGQTIDLISENEEEIPLPLLLRMHELKTGALIRSAARMGCILAGYTGENDKIFDKISTFSEKLGLAFQIKDDILDVTGDEQVFGKPIGSDEGNGKKTFVSLMGLPAAEKRLEELTKDAVKLLSEFGENARFLLEFAGFLLSRNY